MLKNKVNVRATEMELMPHGFLNLNFAMNKGMNEATKCINHMADVMK